MRHGLATGAAPVALRPVPVWLPPLIVYLGIRILGVAVLWVMAAANDSGLFEQLTAWDADWYLGLAEHGYHGMPATSDANDRDFDAAPYAFFPLYPSLTATLSLLPGLDLTAAGLVLSTLAGLAAVPAITRLARYVDPRPRVGLLLVALTAGAPMAITLSMVYTEALFMALAAWTLVAVLERRWLPAGGLCALAGLTRSSAVVLVVVVVAAALWAAWRHREGWVPVLGAVVAPLGVLGFWIAVLVRTGMTWQEIEQRGWDVGWDFGQGTLEWLGQSLVEDRQLMQLVAVAVLLAATVLASLMVRRVPWPLSAYAIGAVLLVVGVAGFPFMKPRFLLVAAFVLLLPVAIGLANRRAGTAIAVTVGYVLGFAWFSGYSLAIWPYAI